MACAAWLALGQVVLWRMIRRSVCAPEAVVRMVDARMRVGRRTSTSSVESRPVVRVSAGLSRPVTCGVWRPTILLPESLMRDGCRAQLRQVLLHELGHVQQGDGWGGLLFCVAMPLFYFHPLYWWLRQCSNLARELVADDWAARADGKEAYVSELVALARTTVARIYAPVGAIGILQSRSHFYRRMRMLLQRNNPLATRCSTACRAALVVGTIIAVMGMATMVGVRPARAQSAPPAAEKGAADQTIGSHDVLHITMTDSAGPGAESVVMYPVNEKGNVVLPLVGSVKAVGLTREELEKAIAQLYRDKNLTPSSPVSIKFIEKGQMPAAAGAGAAPRQAIEKFTTDQISMVDPLMRKMKAERDVIAARVEELTAKGLGDDQPEMAKAQDELAVAERKMKAYSREWRDMQTRLQKDAVQRPGAAVPIPLLPAPGAQAQGAAAVGGVQLDLVNLANTMVDAMGAVRLAKLKVAASQRMKENQAISDLEQATNESNLQTAEKRLELLKGIASIALEGATVDAKRAEQLYKQGVQSAQEVSEAMSKMKMLELIVKGAQ
jgi:beta-lactamase regulating signal transducer with metallopeptidase domain